MHSTALPLTLPSLTSDRRQDLLKQKPLLSLYELFATLPDPRSCAIVTQPWPLGNGAVISTTCSPTCSERAGF